MAAAILQVFMSGFRNMRMLRSACATAATARAAHTVSVSHRWYRQGIDEQYSRSYHKQDAFHGHFSPSVEKRTVMFSFSPRGWKGHFSQRVCSEFVTEKDFHRGIS
jgi:hypothetical protein